MTTLAWAPTVLVAATIAAAIDEGRIPGRVVLLTVNCAAVPEVTAGVADLPRLSAIAERFHAVLDLNAIVEPHHPEALASDRRAASAVREAVEAAAGDAIDVVVGPDRPHTLAGPIAQMFPHARLWAVATDIAADGAGLRLQEATRARLDHVLHLDLVPGRSPVASRPDVATTRIGTSAYLAVIADLAGCDAPLDTDEAWILSERGPDEPLLSAAAEESLQLLMIEALADSGHTSVAVAVHPADHPTRLLSLAERASQRGLELRRIAPHESLEVRLGESTPRLVLGHATSTLALASSLHGVRALSVDRTDLATGLPASQESPAAVVAERRAERCASLQPGSAEAGTAEGTRERPRLTPPRLARLLRSGANVAQAVWFRVRL